MGRLKSVALIALALSFVAVVGCGGSSSAPVTAPASKGDANKKDNPGAMKELPRQ